MAKLRVENKSASIARTFFLGFCGNLVKFFYFSLNWSFLIGNATLTTFVFINFIFFKKHLISFPEY